jgi:hypothetical protein
MRSRLFCTFASVIAISLAVTTTVQADNYYFRAKPITGIPSGNPGNGNGGGNPQPADPISLSLTGGSIGTVGQSMAAQIVVSGGTAPFNFAVQSGQIPEGLSLTQSGNIAGVVSRAGSYSANIQVSDGRGMKSSVTYSSNVFDPLGIFGSPAVAGEIDEPYSAVFVADGGHAPYTYSMTGTLPQGFAFENGVLSGTPVVSGSFGPFTIKANDADGRTASAPPFSVTVATPDPISLSLSGGSTGTVGQLMASQIVVSGGKAPFSFAIESGEIPAGLSLAQSGEIAGVAARAGSYSASIQVSDARGMKSSVTYSSDVFDPLGISGTPAVAGEVDEPYSAAFVADGGHAPYTYSIVGTLPQGLAFNSGTLSGTPAVSGIFGPFTIKASDVDGRVASAPPFSVTVAPAGPLTISGTPAAGVVGTSYSFVPTAKGGKPPYSFSVTTAGNETLDQFGLVFNAGNGRLSGTLTNGGTWTGSITISDAAGAIVRSGALSIPISSSNAPTISGDPRTPVALNAAYQATNFTASGGILPYKWTLANGTTAVPPGMSINATTGALAGTPTTAGTYNFKIIATGNNGSGIAGNKTVSLIVNNTFSITSGGYAGINATRSGGQVLDITTDTYNATGSVAYTATGLTNTGLVLTPSTGRLTGTVLNNPGVYPITVSARDSAGKASSWDFTLLIGPSTSSPGSRSIKYNGALVGTTNVERGVSVPNALKVGDTIELIYKDTNWGTVTYFGYTGGGSGSLKVEIGDGTTYRTCPIIGTFASGTDVVRGNCTLPSGAVPAKNWKVTILSLTGTVANTTLSTSGILMP